jgi:hypothetical protein
MFDGTCELTAEAIQSADIRCSRKNKLPRNTQKTMKIHFTVFTRNLTAFFKVAAGPG